MNMTKQEIDAIPRRNLSDLIKGWDDLSMEAKVRIESAFNAEWWRGYHAKGSSANPITL